MGLTPGGDLHGTPWRGFDFEKQSDVCMLIGKRKEKEMGKKEGGKRKTKK